MNMKTRTHEHPAIKARQDYHEAEAERLAAEALAGGAPAAVTTPEPTPAPAPAPAPAATTPGTIPASAATDVFGFGTPAPAAPAPTEPVADPRVAELERQLAEANAAREASQAELTQRTTAAQTTEAELQELREYRRQAELKAQLNLDNVDFENADPAAAREIADKVLAPILTNVQKDFEKRTAQLTEQLNSERENRTKREKEETLAQQRQRIAKTNAELEAAVPGAASIVKSPAFVAYLSKPVSDKATMTLGEVVATEYHKGNIAYVASAIKAFADAKPDLDAVASAPTVTTASAPAQSSAEDDGTLYNLDTLREMNEKMRSGQIDREEYRAWYDKYKQHKA